MSDPLVLRGVSRTFDRDPPVYALQDVDLAIRPGEVVAVLRAKPRDLHVIVTSRNARPELIEAADLVTEMTLVKHPFRAGVKAQPGIEF